MSDVAGGHPRALAVSYSETAEAEIAEAYDWLLRFGFQTAENWLKGLQASVVGEAELLSAVSVHRATLPGRPAVSLMAYGMGGRKSSTWHVGYEVADEDEDGEDDTLRVVLVRHAARGEA